MPLRFATLASGSTGNVAFIEADGSQLLIDLGLGPRQMDSRLAAVGTTWQSIRAVVLTHTHSDHWKDRSFAQLLRFKIPIYCHARHQSALRDHSTTFAKMLDAGLVHHYEAGIPIEPIANLRFCPLRLSHDSDPTFGFRIEHSGQSGHHAMLGYLADLGTWTTDLVAAVADVDLLALEFNHDVQLEKQSGRPQDLIDRVLGDSGHLSNKQAADFVVELRRQQGAGRLRELVQLHLSQVCNHPTLARRTADEAVADWPLPPRIHTSLPHQAGTILEMPVAAG